MARKTNKTAHVLNLITNSSKENEDEELDNDLSLNDIANLDATSDLNTDIPELVTDSSPQIEHSKPSTSSNAPLVEILYNEHDPLSDLIKNVLEDTAKEPTIINNKTHTKPSTGNSPDLHEEQKEVVTAKPFDFNLEFDDNGNEIEHIEPEPTLDIEPEPTLDPEPTEANVMCDENNDCDNNNTKLFEQLEMAKNEHFHHRKDLNSMIDLDFKYINVYEIIVQDKLLDYMKKFDVCMCDRCIVDTFALAVTALPNKIVVVDKKEIFPLVNFFEVQNTAIISTALIKACMVVKEKPHHT